MDGLDDVFDDELDLGAPNEIIEQVEPDDVPIFDEVSDKVEPTILDELLKSRGIVDSKLLILDENNEEKEVNFFSLTKEEQLDILNSVETPEPQTDLNKDEQDLIKYLRDNNVTLEQYLKEYEKSIVSGLDSTPSYDIDAYDDQELFLLDLKAKYDLTDEELARELEKELQDNDLFLKKVSKLRAEYKQLEDTYKAEEAKEAETQRETQYNTFVDTMVDVAVKTPDLYGIELEDDEKNEVLSFLLEVDDNGVSDFYKTLNTPQKLYEAAWFLKYGKDAFEAIKNAYELEINKLKKDNPKIVVRREQQKETSIHDLF